MIEFIQALMLVIFSQIFLVISILVVAHKLGMFPELFEDIKHAKRRLTKRDLIEELEGMRQGFRDAVDFAPTTEDNRKVFTVSMAANHRGLDRIIVELGGESVYTKDKE